MDLSHINWETFLAGSFAYGVVAYALRTIPPQSNPWAKWLIGILQFAFSNLEHGKAQITQPPAPPAQ